MQALCTQVFPSVDPVNLCHIFKQTLPFLLDSNSYREELESDSDVPQMLSLSYKRLLSIHFYQNQEEWQAIVAVHLALRLTT